MKEIVIKAKSFDLEEIERLAIEKCLAEHSDNKSEAARLLGIDRRTLYRKMKRLGMDGASDNENGSGAEDTGPITAVG